jgi:hypothetical protein
LFDITKFDSAAFDILTQGRKSSGLKVSA